MTPRLLHPPVARAEWRDLKTLLASKATLSERADILPFFRSRHDLSLLIGYYFPNIRRPDVFAHEFPLGGDFTPDLVVGDSSARQYVIVQFENAADNSVFTGSRSKKAWAPRFEGAFSQLVDWIWKLDDMRSTQDFIDTFGAADAEFRGLVVIGKDQKHTASEARRLRWRVEHTLVDSKRVDVRSFDQLSDDIDFWLSGYHQI